MKSQGSKCEINSIQSTNLKEETYLDALNGYLAIPRARKLP